MKQFLKEEIKSKIEKSKNCFPVFARGFKMSIYPTAIPDDTNYPNKTNDVDWIYAALYNDLKEEVLALCKELGISPSGDSATLVARLDALLADKILEGDSSVEVIDTGTDGNVQIKTENVLVGQFHPDGIIDLPKQSKCRVHLATTNQAIPHGANTKIEFNGKDYDIQNEFDNVTNHRFTATKTGYYQVSGTILYLHSIADRKYIAQFYKNGVRYNQLSFQASSAFNMSVIATDVTYLEENDYLEFWTYHYSDVEKPVIAGTKYSYMSIHKLS